MAAVVTSEAAVRFDMADMVRINIPPHFHFRESVFSELGLNCGDNIADQFFVISIDICILLPVIISDTLINKIKSAVGAAKFLFQQFHCYVFQVWKIMWQFPCSEGMVNKS